MRASPYKISNTDIILVKKPNFTEVLNTVQLDSYIYFLFI